MVRKSIGIILCGVLIFTSCRIKSKKELESDTISQPIQIKELGTSSFYVDKYYQIYTLEGCEYVVVSPGNRGYSWGTHKGNCKNPIHKESR